MRLFVSFLSAFLLISFFSCTQGGSGFGNYDEELDDIVMGIYFGMEKQDFLDHCWDLNQEGKTAHGTINNMVMYQDSLNFDPKVIVNFYPAFEKGVISEMPYIFYFNAWSPWNADELSQDKLYEQVIAFFEKKYDTKLEIKDAPNGKHLHYKTLGPLMIRVYRDTDQMKVFADVRNFAYMDKKKSND